MAERVGRPPVKDAGHVMAVDPGGTVGVAWAPLWYAADAPEPGKWNAVGWEEIDAGGSGRSDAKEGKAVLRVLVLMKQYNVRLLVVEGFAARPAKVLKGNWMSPIRQDAMIRFMLDQKWVAHRVEAQQSSDMTTMTDARLKRLGLWIPGKPHARDATRHLVVALRRIRDGSYDVA